MMDVLLDAKLHVSTDVRLKKRILRTLLHEIVVDVDADAGEIILTLHWKGGVHTFSAPAIKSSEAAILASAEEAQQ